MFKYIKFFFGSKFRAVVSLTAFTAFGVTVYHRPELIVRGVERGLTAILAGVFMAVGPYMAPLFMLALTGIALRIMLRGFKSK